MTKDLLSLQKLALFAGSGNLPQRIIEACQKKKIPLFVLAFSRQTPEDFFDKSTIDHAWVQLGAIGEIISILKKQGVSHVVFAGGITRPSWSELGLDWTGTKWLAKIGMKSLGDDGLLSAAIDLLENEGFQVVAVDKILTDILCPAGLLTPLPPSQEDYKDIAYGTSILNLLGPADVGQAVVIQNGIVLAIEAIEGTKDMLSRVKNLKRPGPGGVLVKMLKPGQNRCADLPSIGPDTVRQAVEAGLVGIAVEAGATHVIDQEKTLDLACSNNLFLIGLAQPFS